MYINFSGLKLSVLVSTPFGRLIVDPLVHIWHIYICCGCIFSNIFLVDPLLSLPYIFCPIFLCLYVLISYELFADIFYFLNYWFTICFCFFIIRLNVRSTWLKYFIHCVCVCWRTLILQYLHDQRYFFLSCVCLYALLFVFLDYLLVLDITMLLFWHF